MTVTELQRAWRAVQAGLFTDPPPGDDAADAAPRVWCPEPAERVLPVVGAVPGTGATVLALALATVGAPARVVECTGLAIGGLAAAPTAELGVRGGWVRGSRADVIIERLQDTWIDPSRVPFPPLLDRISRLTVLDVSWDPTLLLSTPTWLTRLLTDSPQVVVVGTATVPGLRRLENVVQLLGVTRCVVAVLGPSRRRWPRTLIPGADLTRLAAAGR
ncbi:MAG: hypothetical protein ACOH1Y_17120, partial [Propionicimonas sp.]